MTAAKIAPPPSKWEFDLKRVSDSASITSVIALRLF
jgi:hypothetical protein